jgi:hypothetical protein
MARSISAQDMYAHLSRELQSARKSECASCRVPKPFWGPSAGPGASGYWYMETPNKCDNGCREILARVWADLTTEYTIEPPPREAIISGSAYARRV